MSICLLFLFFFNVCFVVFRHRINDSNNKKNVNVSKNGRVNAFWDFNKNDLSDIALYFLGGIFEHLGAITAFVCPTQICYATRFNSPWVSKYGNWGKFNRVAMIRVKPNRNGKNTHFEFRLPSSLSNPYLIMASIVCAGIDGIKNKILAPNETPIEMKINCQEYAQNDKQCYKNKIPLTLEDALKCLENDKIFSQSLGSFFVKCYIATKRLEIKEMQQFKQNKMRPLCYSLL